MAKPSLQALLLMKDRKRVNLGGREERWGGTGRRRVRGTGVSIYYMRKEIYARKKKKVLKRGRLHDRVKVLAN